MKKLLRSLVSVVVLFLLLSAAGNRISHQNLMFVDQPASFEAAGDHAFAQLRRALARQQATPKHGGDDPLATEIHRIYDQAVGYYQQAFDIAPSVRLLVKLGHLHLQIGDIGRARRAFVEALTKWPGTPSAYAGLGDVLFAFGDYRGAIENYQNALWWQVNGTPDPGLDVIALRLSLAEAFSKLRLLSAAIEQYETVLAEEPHSARALTGMFGIHVIKGEWTEALTVLERWHMVAPSDPLLAVAVQQLVGAAPTIPIPSWATDIANGLADSP